MGRVIVLLLLIIAMAGGGMVWFDYLGIIDVKNAIAPVYRLIGREGRTQSGGGDEEFLNLDAERLMVRLESLELRDRELDNREDELTGRYGEIEQMAQELEARQKALDDRENSINAGLEETDNRERNVEQNARYLTGMPPERAVGIISAMVNDQDIIDVFRKTEEIAQAEGTTSIVSYWLSLMAETAEGAARAAELQRKMAGRP